MKNLRVPAGDSGWVWHPERSVGGGIVEVEVAWGARLWVHALRPDHVLAFEALDRQALTALGNVFGVQWVHAVGTDFPSVSDEPTWNPDPLPDSWERLAVVEGVRQWMPQPLNESALIADLALAWHHLGATERATRLIRAVAPEITSLRVRAFDGEFSALSRDLLARAADLAVGALPVDDEDRHVLTEIDAAIHGEVARAVVDADWEQDGIQFRLEAEHAAMALVAGGSDPDACMDAQSDLLAVFPRLLRWDGAEAYDITAEPTADAGGSFDDVRVQVSLASPWALDSVEAHELFAVLCDAGTGEPWSHELLESDPFDTSANLTAYLPLHGRDPEELTVQVYSGELSSNLRATPLGRGLLAADRHLIGGWSELRLSAAGRAGADTRRALNSIRSAHHMEADLPMLAAEARPSAAEQAAWTGLGPVLAASAELGQCTSVATSPLLAEALPAG